MTGRYSIRSHAAGAWTLVDPSGTPTCLLGVNHVDDALDDPAALRRLGSRAAVGAFVGGHLRLWGYSNVGYGLSPADARASVPGWPYLAALNCCDVEHWRPRASFAYPDVFAPDFADAVERRAAEVCGAGAGDPCCVGYYWADTPQWDLDRARRTRGIDWVSALRALPAGAPGKAAYLDFLLGRHGTLDRLNRAYGTAFRRPDDVAASPLHALPLDRPEVRGDDDAFLGRVAARLYALLAGATRRHDPGGLVFGERYKAGDHPPAVLAEAARHVDVLSVQPGPACGPAPGPGETERHFDRAAFRALHAITGRPVVVCDHQVSFPTSADPVTLWEQSADAARAGEVAAAYQLDALAEPYVVGYQRCQAIDVYQPARGLVKRGLFNADLRPYDALVAPLARANASSRRLHEQRLQPVAANVTEHGPGPEKAPR